MKKAVTEIIWIIFILIVGLALFVVFYGRIIPSVLYSECWNGQIKAAGQLIPSSRLSGVPVGEAGLVLKPCLLAMAIGDNSQEDRFGRDLCQRFCDTIVGEENAPSDTDCERACNQCGDRGIVFMVPTIPGTLDTIEDLATRIASRQLTFDDLKKHISDSSYCMSTGKKLVPGTGEDRKLGGLKITKEKGNVACLNFRQRSDDEVTVDLVGYTSTGIASAAAAPEDLYKIFCSE